MKKTIALLLLLAAPATYAAPVVAAPPLAASLRADLMIMRFPLLAAGYGSTGATVLSGAGAVFDPIVPTDGTQNITGNLVVSSSISVTGEANFVDGEAAISMAGGPGTGAAQIVVEENGASSVVTIYVDDGSSDAMLTLEGDGLTYDSPITSTLATGTAPFTIASTTKVTNLNADAVDGVSISGTPDGTKFLRDDGVWTAVSTGIAGSTGATDNAMLAADGTGGATLQARAITVGDVATNVLPIKVTGTDAIHIIGDISTATATSTVAAVEVGSGDAFAGADAVFIVNESMDSAPAALFTVDGGGGGTFTGQVSALNFSATSTASTFATSTVVRIGSGTDDAAITGNLDTVSTAVGNVGASGPDDLQSYSIPGSALTTTNRGVRITAWGTCSNSANAKTFTLNFGSQVVLTHACTVSVASQWKIVTEVIRTGSSTQDWTSVYTGNSGAANAFEYDPEIGTATQTESGAIVVKMQSTVSTTDNDIVQEGQIIESI